MDNILTEDYLDEQMDLFFNSCDTQEAGDIYTYEEAIVIDLF